MKEVKTEGDKLAGMIVRREKLRADLKDMSAAYREQINELEERIKECAFNADQVLLAFEDSEKTNAEGA